MTSDYNLSPHIPGNHYSYNNGAVHFYGEYLKYAFYPGRTEVQMLQDAYVSALSSRSTFLPRLPLGLGWRLVDVNTRHGAHRVFGSA